MLGFVFRRAFTAAILPLKPNTLSDNYGARYKSKKLGRGRASGVGKTSGRGHKGQNARTGGPQPPRFEGGQTPISMRIPKWGMNRTAFATPLDPLNFSKLYYYIEKGRIDTSKPITIRDMFESGIYSRIKHGVKLLARGLDKIDRPLHLEVTDASKKAVEAVKAKGGSVTLLYKTQRQLLYHIKPYIFDLPMRDIAMPPPTVAIKLRKKEETGAIVKFIRPSWLSSYQEPVVAQIPKFHRKPKPLVVRHFDFGIRSV